MINEQNIIAQTKKWITDVVIGCNFCPFAQKEMKQNTVYYQVQQNATLATALEILLKECIRLDENGSIETTFIIFPGSFIKFDSYLELVELAEKILKKEKYEGVYQVASFHPLYQFAGTGINDAANYTNRSIYPMLHILREASIEKVLEKFPDAENIYERNINFTKEKGEAYMKMLRDTCT